MIALLAAAVTVCILAAVLTVGITICITCLIIISIVSETIRSPK